MIWTFGQGVLYYAIVFLVVLGIKLVNDWYAKNKQKRVISHWFSVVMDGVALSAAASYIFSSSLLMSNWVVFGMIVIAAGLRWILFDGFFNLINGDKWNHRGKTSKLDRFLDSIGNFQYVIKPLVVLIGVSIVGLAI